MEGGDSISLKGVPLLGRPICGGIEEGAHLGHGGRSRCQTSRLLLLLPPKMTLAQYVLFLLFLSSNLSPSPSFRRGALGLGVRNPRFCLSQVHPSGIKKWRRHSLTGAKLFLGSDFAFPLPTFLLLLKKTALASTVSAHDRDTRLGRG